MGLEREKSRVKLIFFLKTYGCWKNAVEASSAGACGAGQEQFAGQREVAQCLSVSSSVQRVHEGKCLEKVAGKLLSAPYDCSFFWILFALSRNWALNMLLKPEMC